MMQEKHLRKRANSQVALATSFHATQFLLKRMIERQTITIKIWIFCGHFLENKLTISIPSRKTNETICFQ